MSTEDALNVVRNTALVAMIRRLIPAGGEIVLTEEELNRNKGFAAAYTVRDDDIVFTLERPDFN